jgi:hypothetical protein
VVSFTPRPLYPQEKSPHYPLDGRLGGSQSRSGRGGEENEGRDIHGKHGNLVRNVVPNSPTILPFVLECGDDRILHFDARVTFR